MFITSLSLYIFKLGYLGTHRQSQSELIAKFLTIVLFLNEQRMF